MLYRAIALISGAHFDPKKLKFGFCSLKELNKDFEEYGVHQTLYRGPGRKISIMILRPTGEYQEVTKSSIRFISGAHTTHWRSLRLKLSFWSLIERNKDASRAHQF